MSQYHQPPSGAAPVVVADADEVVRLRPMLTRYLRKIGVDELYIPDLIQETISTTWEALHEGRVRGADNLKPEQALCGFARQTAWRHAMNLMRRASMRLEIPMSAIQSPPDLVTPDPMSEIEARDLLTWVMKSRPRLASIVLLAARGLIGPEAARTMGHGLTAHYAHVQKLRAALRAASTPKQAPRPTWKSRKAKR
ncbi:RNA polymerase sigma factor [Polyangium fumosum]|uniref:Sigma-70 family RNA polymerase sigma factor n=1 Tax=Polyangium fumosum TaxID=889272 RepID=A0A4U1JFY4_9BACT|nr:sigma-70 family RNA polymerase sigma factor [Polyangium fumosum]TKD08959.1 sigma-70 family RNA polymerase sigma factor [Polyangium fumosum]